MNTKNIIKIGLISSILLSFSGCSLKQTTNDDAIRNIVSFKHQAIEGEKNLKQLNIKEDTTLAGCYGPSTILSEEDYSILTYSNKTMLFAGYGIKDKIYFLTNSNLNIKEKDIKARDYGFKDLNHMFSYLFNYYKTKDINEIKGNLSYLIEQDLITLNSLSDEAINEKTEEIYSYSYFNYLEMQKDKNTKYGIWINNEFITLSKQDFKPYALIIQVMDQLLDNSNSKGVKIYGN